MAVMTGRLFGIDERFSRSMAEIPVFIMVAVGKGCLMAGMISIF